MAPAEAGRFRNARSGRASCLGTASSFRSFQLNRPSIPRRGAHPAARPIGRSDLPSEAPAPQTRGFCLSGASGLSPFWFSSPPKPSRQRDGAPEEPAPKRGSPSAGSAGASVRGRQLRHGNLAHPEYHHLIAGHCDPTAMPILFVRASGKREAANILCGGSRLLLCTDPRAG